MSSASGVTANFAGLGSGIDVNSLVAAMMQVESRTQDQLKARLGTVQTEISTWATITTQINNVQTASNALAHASDWNLLTATSSNPAAVDVSASSAGATGAVSFTVDKLALAHAVRSTNTVAALTTPVAAGSVTLTKNGGTPTTINVGDGSLSSVVNAINSSNNGVTAAAVQVGANAYRLQVTANGTGAASSFTLDLGGGSALGPSVVLAQGDDAQITIGSGPGSYTIGSASNTISNILPGLSVTLKGKSTDPVTVSTARDTGGLADKMQKMVDAANAALAQINLATKYDASNNTASPLTGDFTARNAATQIRNAIITAVDPQSQYSAGVLGVQIDKTGNVTFDRSKFINALNTNFSTVVSTFAQQSTATDPTVSFVAANTNANGGTYAVTVSQAALQATETSAAASWPAASPFTMQYRVGTTVASFNVTAGMTADQAVVGLNAAVTAQGLHLVATQESGDLVVRSTDFGASQTFDVSYDGGGSWATRTGQDVAGTINGVAATGLGRTLSLPSSDPTAPGLAVQISATPAQVTSQGGNFGTVTFNQGVAQRLSQTVKNLTDPISGAITSTVTADNNRITDLNRQIARWDVVLAARELRLRTQYAALDSTIGQMKSNLSSLQSQINGLGTSG